jgi:hypothetical protein
MPWKFSKKQFFCGIKCLLGDKYNKQLLRKVVSDQHLGPYTKFQNHRPNMIFHFFNVYFFTNQRILFLTILLL